MATFGVIRSKLGRRFFFLLFIVACAPMLTMAYLTYQNVDKHIIQQYHEGLASEAQFYSHVVLQRLSIVHGQFSSFTASDTDNKEKALSEGFMSLARQDWNDFELESKHLTLSQKSHIRKMLDTGRPLLLVRPKKQVYLYKYVREAKTKSLMLAKLDMPWLLGDKEMQNSNRAYCIFGSMNQRLYCSKKRVISSARFKTLINKFKGSELSMALDWAIRDKHYVAQVYTVQMKEKFGLPDWKVMVSESGTEMFSIQNEMKETFTLVIFVTVLVAAILGYLLILRMLSPLRSLMKGTREVANCRFDVKVDVHSNDELRELADSFNLMARQIGKQFNLLNGLSGIDQLILNVPDPDQVAQSALTTMRSSMDSDAAAVALRDPVNRNDVSLFNCFDSNLERHSEQIILSEQEMEWLEAVPPIHRATLNDAAQLNWLWPDRSDLLGGSTYVFPIFANNANHGILALSWKKSFKLPEQDRFLMKDFSDRLAVAITAMQRERALYQRTHFDELTQLPNRQLLKDRLSQSLKHVIKHSGAGAVLYVDLDKFQDMNETEGHATGDRVLQRSAERLLVSVSSEDTVARQGADEFVVILNDIDSPMRATRVAEKILTLLSSPYNISGKRFYITASIGIALFPSDGERVDSLLRKAEMATHRAKHEGGNCHRFFEEDMNCVAQRRASIESRLRHALEVGNLQLYYHPQWYLDSERFSVEALVRLQDEGGTMLPDEFIQVADETGLIYDIGEWVMRTACKQMSEWITQGVEIDRMSVNVSGLQLVRDDFLKIVRNALKSAELKSNYLELEVMESVLIDDPANASKQLKELREMGVSIALDDFGTGYSSLSYLHTLPFDLVKIDQSFMRDLGKSNNNDKIVKTIIELAKSLGKCVIAEGVESKEQVPILKNMQCDAIQGYLISRPLSAKDTAEFLKNFSKDML